jgi:malonyl-CoA decarboxylase
MFEKLKQARRTNREKVDLNRLIASCHQLISERGESNSMSVAAAALGAYRKLSEPAVEQFFEVLSSDFDPDPGEVLILAERYAVDRSAAHLIALSRAAEPPRQELLRRLNRAPGGAAEIVDMRARLLGYLKKDRRLEAVDADFEHLLSSWFNPGFLNLVQVDWQSPAVLLEKLIQHEAVHAIDGWGDLRRRLQPDRRCFAFFHPILPNEPLIFVEVALIPEMPSAIAPLLERETPPNTDVKRFKVAAFYSISNCQPGLKGVNLGNFLIKRVAEQLNNEFPSIKTFCTLSPVPGFIAWLDKVKVIEEPRLSERQIGALNQILLDLRNRHGNDLAGLNALVSTPMQSAGSTDETTRKSERLTKDAEHDLNLLQRLCAFFLWQTAADNSRSSDPVARFHLNNGARLERINLRADTSKKGVKQSLAVMVNYLYDLDEVEANHERFVHGDVNCSNTVLKLLR